jgi:hypothetical protein
MRDAIQDQKAEAAEEFEETIQPLELRSDKAAQLAAALKVTDAQIALLENEYMPLTCTAGDKKAFDVAHSARMDIKDLRVQVEKTRKDLVKDAVDWQKTVNGEAKRITGLLEPIETHLEKQEAIYTAEQDRIKAERQREAQARIQVRIDALAAVGVTANLAEIALMPDEAFQRYLALETESFARAEAVKAEAKAKADAEEAARAARMKAETEALEALRKAQAEEKARLDVQAAALKAQQDAMDAKQRAIDQAAREEQARKEGEAKAKADAEQAAKDAEAKREQAEKARIVAQEQEAKAQAELKAAEEAKAAAIEAARPDAEKLLTLAMETESWNFPEMSSVAGRAAMALIEDANKRFAAFIRKQAEGLAK